MDNLIFYSFCFLFLLPIIIGFYFDSKKDPKKFKFSLRSFCNKRSTKALLFSLIYFSLVKIYKHTNQNPNNLKAFD